MTTTKKETATAAKPATKPKASEDDKVKQLQEEKRELQARIIELERKLATIKDDYNARLQSPVRRPL